MLQRSGSVSLFILKCSYKTFATLASVVFGVRGGYWMFSIGAPSPASTALQCCSGLYVPLLYLVEGKQLLLDFLSLRVVSLPAKPELHHLVAGESRGEIKKTQLERSYESRLQLKQRHSDNAIKLAHAARAGATALRFNKLLSCRAAAFLSPPLSLCTVWVVGLTTTPSSHEPRTCWPMRTEQSVTNYSDPPTHPSIVECGARFIAWRPPSLWCAETSGRYLSVDCINPARLPFYKK